MAKRRKGGSKSNANKKKPKLESFTEAIDNELVSSCASQTIKEDCSQTEALEEKCSQNSVPIESANETSSQTSHIDADQCSQNSVVSVQECTQEFTQECTQEFDEIAFSQEVCDKENTGQEPRKQLMQSKEDSLEPTMNILAQKLDKFKQDLCKVNEYISHWKAQFDVAKRDHAAIMKGDLFQK